MLARTNSNDPRDARNEDSRPLLADDDEEHDHPLNSPDREPSRRRNQNHVVFAVDDEGDEEDTDDYQPLGRGGTGKLGDEAHQLLNEDFPRHGPPLRSTIQSREAQFELDSDVLDDYDLRNHLHPDSPSDGTGGDMRRGRRSSQSAPLLVGLLDSATRRSFDVPLTPNGRLPFGGGEADERLDLEDIAARRHAGGGLLDSVANMANSILGAVTDWTIMLIVKNAKLSGRSSYIEIMEHCFGPSGKAFVSLFQFAFAFGGMCAFGIIIGDTIPHVIRSIFPSLATTPILSIFTNRQFIIGFCTICISYPLSLYRDIHKLSRASGFALIGMLIIVGSVVFEGPHANSSLKGDPSQKFTIIEPRIFEAIGVISFAFVCHHNSLLIYGSLNTPTLDRFAKVTHISTFISLVCCLLMAISAYVVFTDKTQGNILNNFSPTDPLINVARFCFGLNMFTTLPLELFVCREVIEQYFFSHESFNQQRHILFTTSILFSSIFISMITCDLGVMMELTGGMSATALAFIFPAVCYIKLSDPHAGWSSRTKLPAYACASFGVVVLVLSVCLALSKVWTSQDGGASKICV
ncbi:hypothetical protein FRB99_001445 [Tulasnella sp. 403]|nr:hypothetical protein FRB99_001445 [Tulasnella sp. 403]